jgi:hypothetical protein
VRPERIAQHRATPFRLDLLGREDLREAWERYVGEPTWENLEPLILRIREADQGEAEDQPDADALP